MFTEGPHGTSEAQPDNIYARIQLKRHHRPQCSKRNDVPPQIIAQNELLLPGCLLPPEHQGPVVGVIVQVALRCDPEVLVDVCSPPGVIVGYVGMELLAYPREGEEVGRVEEGSDVSERFRWKAEQSAWCAGCVRVAVQVSMLARSGVRAKLFVSVIFGRMSFDGPIGHKKSNGE